MYLYTAVNMALQKHDYRQKANTLSESQCANRCDENCDSFWPFALPNDLMFKI